MSYARKYIQVESEAIEKTSQDASEGERRVAKRLVDQHRELLLQSYGKIEQYHNS